MTRRREHGNDQHKAMEVYKALLIYDKTRDSADVGRKWPIVRE